jgi:hypothetical protein
MGVAMGMRPRANTISSCSGDARALHDFLASQAVPQPRNTPNYLGHSRNASYSSGMPASSQWDFRGMSTAMGSHGPPQGLSRLNTQLGHGFGGGLRTAPLQGHGPDDATLANFFGEPSGPTVNPNQLHHFNVGMAHPQSPFLQFANPFGETPIEEDVPIWSAGFDHPMGFPDNALDASSPSAMSAASQGPFHEVLLDSSGQPVSAAQWHNTVTTQADMNPDSFPLSPMAPAFHELLMNNGMPHDFNDSIAPNDFYMPSPPGMSAMSPSAAIPGMPNQYFAPVTFNSDAGSISSTSINGSARHSSVTSVSTDTITESTRQALIHNLSLAMGFGHPKRRFSQPSVSSPLSMPNNGKNQTQRASLPKTEDIQRYVNAYIMFFHPHLPFLHIATLSFDTPAYTHHLRTPNHIDSDDTVGGGGCLILAMAAIGALYEFEPAVAKDLFDAAKKLILYYLDERRKACVSAAGSGPSTANDCIDKPPLWLVQAMLLNLIYGHNSGDQQSAQIASTHCVALVSLARAAGLDRPPTTETVSQSPQTSAAGGDTDMHGTPEMQQTARGEAADEHSQWVQWKTVEERKRTYFAVFAMSALLVSAYAHNPRILNSEIRLDLPCEEDLWSVDNPRAWVAMGGPIIAQTKSLSFIAAMTYLLDANSRRAGFRSNSIHNPAIGGNQAFTDPVESDIRPSTFGCYVLINALHVYIWETRQRHTGQLWKAAETGAMHAQIEPALKAWQAAWRANPNHSIERPSPFGPLSADCIPLLDLAYIRLFVNLGRAKELLWQRDFDGMAVELAKSVDLIPRDDSPERSLSMAAQEQANLYELNGLQVKRSTKQERHLRKAAFYAADSLSMADKLGATYAEFTARELPNSSALCTLDCAQVLAEWVAAVQDRVGCFVGILGKDDIDFAAVPACLLLEDEDVKLLQKTADILHSAELKLAYDISSNAMPIIGGLSSLSHCGFGTKLLKITAYMLRKAAVWPGTLYLDM